MSKSSPLNFRFSPLRKLLSLLFLCGGIGCLGWYFTHMDASISGTKTLFVLDTSLSTAVQDIVGEKDILISRLDAAKRTVPELMTEQNALMTFSDVSTLELPFSPDAKTLLATLDILTPTSYGHATSIESVLKNIDTLYGGKTPIRVVLFTDGENTAPTSSSSSFPDISPNLSLTFVGVGTEAGGTMLQGYDESGRPRYKQYEGKDALSRRDTAFLEKLQKTYHARLFLMENISATKNISSFSKSALSFENIPRMLIFGVLFLLASRILLPYTLTTSGHTTKKSALSMLGK